MTTAQFSIIVYLIVKPLMRTGTYIVGTALYTTADLTDSAEN